MENININKSGQFMKGHKPWNKGTHIQSNDALNDYVKSHGPWNRGLKTGIVPKHVFQKGHVPWNKGLSKKTDSRLHCTEERRKKMKKIAKEKGFGKWMYGKKVSSETKQKLRRIAKDKKFGVWMSGRSVPEDVRKKISSSLKQKWENSLERKQKYKEMFSGENSPTWFDGRSFEPYGSDFNDELKAFIKQRDGGICQLCGTDEDLVVHHIDYCKTNNDITNVVTLCRSCNAVVNYNRRWWIEYFLEI